jgi:hypothetical protein
VRYEDFSVDTDNLYGSIGGEVWLYLDDTSFTILGYYHPVLSLRGGLIMTFKEAIEAKTEKAKERFDNEIEQIANDVREKVIVPICKRRKWTFSSGMGIYGFYRTDNRPIMEAETLPKDVDRALEICSIEVSYSSELGHYINDYQGE